MSVETSSPYWWFLIWDRRVNEGRTQWYRTACHGPHLDFQSRNTDHGNSGA